MNSIILSFAACVGTAFSALAQLGAPSSAQVWDVRFVVDSAGAFAAGPAATAVGITIMARVGILPNTSAARTNNFGVSRIGGAGTATSGFRVSVVDPASAAAGRNQGSLQQGVTGDIRTLDPVTGQFSPTGVPTLLLDTAGQPLRGHFAPFRGTFSPQVSPLFVGENAASANGLFLNPEIGSPMMFNLVGSRGFNFGSEGTTGFLGVCVTPSDSDPANLVGELASVYRFVFLPSAGEANRTILVTSVGQTARYGHTFRGEGVSSALSPIADMNFAFQVPSASAAAVPCVAATLLSRHRRGSRLGLERRDT